MPSFKTELTGCAVVRSFQTCLVLLAIACTTAVYAQQQRYPLPRPANPGAPPARTPGGRPPANAQQPLARPYYTPGKQQEARAGMIIAGVRVTGNKRVGRSRILRMLRTRPGREFDPEIVQSDVRSLAKSRLFGDVRTFTEVTPDGVVVTFEVVERATLQYVEFIGNRGLRDHTLLKESGLEVGEALDRFTVQEARRKVETYYHDKGFPKAVVVITEGLKTSDKGAKFQISEGPLQRIWGTYFIGNTVASSARLRTLIQSKAGYAWYLFRGEVNYAKIDEDVERLTAYYRNLGYYKASIGRELKLSESGKWLTITFVIDEGPQYSVRNVSIVGNRKFTTEQLKEFLKLKGGDKFLMGSMRRDENTLRDIYGAQGHVYVNVEADLRFLEEPGTLDLVYRIEEGAQYRVGRVNVHIAGDYPHTQENVIRNRIALQPGDILDIRKIRASERLLGASQLFLSDPQRGIKPTVKVQPLNEKLAAEQLAREAGRQTTRYRGQSPESNAGLMQIDVVVHPATGAVQHTRAYPAQPPAPGAPQHSQRYVPRNGY